MKQEALYTFLCKWLSEEKIKRFDEVVSQRTRHIVLVAEDIYQTQNTSALMRTAECCGIQDFHIVENQNSFSLNKRVVKGASDWLTLHRYNSHSDNSVECFSQLKQQGYKIVVTTPHDADFELENLPVDDKLAIVMGTELTGTSPVANAMADVRVSIPMVGFTESMNVSVAGALMSYHLLQRLRMSTIEWKLSPEEQLELKINWAKKSIQSSKQLLELFEKGELN